MNENWTARQKAEEDRDNALIEKACAEEACLKALEERDRLYRAIVEHYEQKGDDRCWLDDQKLYEAAGLDVSKIMFLNPDEMKRNCDRYIAHRTNPDVKYISEAVEIRLSVATKLAAFRKVIEEVLTYAENADANGRLYTPAVLTSDLKERLEKVLNLD